MSATTHRIVLLDDDEDLLELYREILGRLPSKPEIHTATSGARAIALLESDHFSLLISDLNMPRMDGLQVLTIVKRKFPQLRTAVMTSVVDEQFRARAYSMGVDLFLEKPNTQQEISFFLDCIESLLERETNPSGFRGVQSKSLMDLIQLECLSQSSSTLKITNGPSEGRVYIVNGDIIDSSCNDLSGEEAFRKVMSWKNGSFEILPGEPDRTRTIFNSYQGLLLETTQALDEAAGGPDPASSTGEAGSPKSALGTLAEHPGVESILTTGVTDGKVSLDVWGVENPEPTGAWVRKTLEDFRSLGELLRIGQLTRLEAVGSRRFLAMAPGRNNQDICVTFSRAVSHEIARETMKKIVATWVS